MSDKRPDPVASLRQCPALHPLPQARRPGGGEHDDEIADAAWLYAWSHEGVCPVGERLSARLIAAG